MTSAKSLDPQIAVLIEEVRHMREKVDSLEKKIDDYTHTFVAKEVFELTIKDLIDDLTFLKKIVWSFIATVGVTLIGAVMNLILNGGMR